MKKKIILSKRFISEAVDILKENFDLIIAEDNYNSLVDALKKNKDAEALISFLSDKVDKELIDLGENLKIISNYAVGYNNIDVEYAKSKDIYITNTPDILTNATADIAWTLIMACSRRIIEADKFVREGKFDGWGAELLLGKELYGSSIGIVGMGRIGLATALRAKGFGLKVYYYSRSRKPEIEKKEGFSYLPFKDLVKTSDIISLHLPYAPDLHHLFNKEIFDRMKKDAIFINTSRGQLMDEAYLTEKLKKKELFSAGLDVYEFEPRVTEELKQLDNVVLLPHIGSGTFETRLGMAKKNIKDIELTLSGKKPVNLV